MIKILSYLILYLSFSATLDLFSELNSHIFHHSDKPNPVEWFNNHADDENEVHEFSKNPTLSVAVYQEPIEIENSKYSPYFNSNFLSSIWQPPKK